MRRISIGIAIVALCGWTGGCSVSTAEPSPGPVVGPPGTITVDWTINNSTDPNQCIQGDATHIDIVVTAPDGSTVGDFQQVCEDGVTTIGLAPGGYAADAALLDSAGADRTTRLSIDPFVVHSDVDLSISIDFPASSFR